MELRAGTKVSDYLLEYLEGVDNSQFRVFDDLYKLHERYREAGRLSGQMRPREYAEEFIIDAWEGLNSVKPPLWAAVADAGTGAGYPGIPWYLLRRDLSVTLIERNTRKAEYLHFVLRELDLTGMKVINACAEDIDGCFDIVTVKGLGVRMLFKVKQLLATKGKVVVFSSGEEEIPTNVGDLTLCDEHFYVLPFRDARRKIAVYTVDNVSRET
jgi:16S rRNA G527 N7-methylase RsmG